MIDRYGNLMLAGLEPGRLGLYALPSTRQINVFTFPKSVVHKQFSADAKSFVVITSDQTIYTIPIENNVVPK